VGFFGVSFKGAWWCCGVVVTWVCFLVYEFGWPVRSLVGHRWLA